jgi:hypothetical protein
VTHGFLQLVFRNIDRGLRLAGRLLYSSRGGEERTVQPSAQPQWNPPRRHPRVRAMRPVVWWKEDGSCAYLRLVVVSRGGAHLRSPEAIERGTPMRLEICLAGAVIRCRARAVWCIQRSEGFDVGVELTDLVAGDEPLLEHLLDDGIPRR